MNTYANIRWVRIVAGCAILMFMGSCLGIGSSRDESGVREGKWFSIYFGGDEVGEARFEVDIIDLAQDDRVHKTVLTEKINYRGDQYRFEFTLVEDVNKIKVLRHDPENDAYFISDSFSLEMSGGALNYIDYEDDGETVRERRAIEEDNRVENAQELFDKVKSFMLSYYGGKIYNEPPSHYHEYEKYRSLGYELLNYDRL